MIHDPVCGDFTVPRHTYATFEAPYGEKRIVLHCTPGTLSSGAMGAVCRGGVWSAPVGACYFPTYTDPKTGHEWATFLSELVREPADASAYCRDLDATHAWVVPTTAQLMSLLDLEAGSLEYRNPDAFPVADRGKSVRTSDYLLAFRDGIGPYGIYEAGAIFVRCVKPSPTQPLALRDNGDGTITDLHTGLVWQKGFDAHPPTTVDGANRYCRSLGLPGDGWRLPTLRELTSILDYSTRPTDVFQLGALDDAYFPRGQKAALSSTLVPSLPGRAYYLSWYGYTAYRGIFGIVAYDGTPYPDGSVEVGVRCVR